MNSVTKSRCNQNSSVPGGAALFQRMFTRLGCEGRPPRFRVEFYPYSSLTLTIRRREEVVFVRFSDLLRRAPLPVLEAGAALLLSRVYRRRAPAALVEPYLEYSRSGRTRSRMNRMRLRRVRPRHAGARGLHFDLEEMFDELNGKYSAQAPTVHRLELARLAAAIRLLRSRSESNSAESPHGSPRRSRLRRGICLVPRDAARQASHAALWLQPGFPFARISRRGKALSRIHARPPHPRPLRALIPSSAL